MSSSLFFFIFFSTTIVLTIFSLSSGLVFEEEAMGEVSFPDLDAVTLLMSHDAATGFDGDYGVLVDPWVRTQTVDFAGQLDCGARALDVRPMALADGSLFLHHGYVQIKISFDKAMLQAKAWSLKNPTELVIVHMARCFGSNCIALVAEALRRLHIQTINCSKRGGGGGGGGLKAGLFALPFGCAWTHFNQSVQCCPTTFGPCCDDDVKDDDSDSDGRDTAFASLSSYATEAAKMEYDSGEAWILQAHWQTSMWAIIRGTLRGGSVIDDEEKAGVNAWLLEALRAKTEPWTQRLNFIQIDNVCNLGLEIAAVLKQ